MTDEVPPGPEESRDPKSVSGTPGGDSASDDTFDSSGTAAELDLSPEVLDWGPAVHTQPVDLGDYTSDAVEESSPRERNLDEDLADTRKLLALLLIAIFTIVTLVYVLAPLLVDSSAWGQAKPALDKVFTAVVSVTATVVGFYFGTGGSSGKKVKRPASKGKGSS